MRSASPPTRPSRCRRRRSWRCAAATSIWRAACAWSSSSCACCRTPRMYRKARLLSRPSANRNSRDVSQMILRSLLFVPGDSERKLAKAQLSRADALVLDLEDAVAAERLPVARTMVREYLKSRSDRSKQPKCDSAAQTVKLDHYLSALEAREGLARGATKILPVATETPRAMFALDSYVGASDRLAALTWGAEDLSTAIGA